MCYICTPEIDRNCSSSTLLDPTILFWSYSPLHEQPPTALLAPTSTAGRSQIPTARMISSTNWSTYDSPSVVRYPTAGMININQLQSSLTIRYQLLCSFATLGGSCSMGPSPGDGGWLAGLGLGLRTPRQRAASHGACCAVAEARIPWEGEKHRG